MAEMTRTDELVATETGAPALAVNAAVVVSASLFVGLCSRVALPLHFTPVPITLQTFAVLLVGLVLGPRRAAAALALYLAEGAAGMPVFSPLGPGGVAQLLGPTGGFLMAYPVVAALVGTLYEAGKKSVAAAVAGCVLAEAVLYVAGAGWLAALAHIDSARLLMMAILPFLAGDVLKAAAAISVAQGWKRYRKA